MHHDDDHRIISILYLTNRISLVLLYITECTHIPSDETNQLRKIKILAAIYSESFLDTVCG